MTKENKSIEVAGLRTNRKFLIVVVFFSAIVLIVSTYAWLSASLNVRIRFFEMSVSSDSGLFISLDGIDFSSEIELTSNTVVSDLRARYPGHTNQWAPGLWPVSTNGIKNPNRNKFDVYTGQIVKTRIPGSTERVKKLNTILSPEDVSNSSNVYIAFDVFLKNVSGSPRPDNLFFEGETYIEFDKEKFDTTKYTEEEIIESMDGIMNSLRIGLLKMGSVSSKDSVQTIQNIGCNNACSMVIYEPNHLNHSVLSVEIANELGITLVDGVYVPTYAVIEEGTKLEHVNGHVGTGIPLDTAHFKEQETVKDFTQSIFSIPNGITKVRIYIWIEGQDIDSLEINSKGAPINISISLIKDLAGYNVE